MQKFRKFLYLICLSTRILIFHCFCCINKSGWWWNFLSFPIVILLSFRDSFLRHELIKDLLCRPSFCYCCLMYRIFYLCSRCSLQQWRRRRRMSSSRDFLQDNKILQRIIFCIWPFVICGVKKDYFQKYVSVGMLSICKKTFQVFMQRNCKTFSEEWKMVKLWWNWNKIYFEILWRKTHIFILTILQLLRQKST